MSNDTPATTAQDTDIATYDADLMGSGFENVDATQIALPMVALLNDKSKVLSKSKPQYNEDAEAGDFWNSLTGTVSKEVHLVPVHFETHVVEWRDRNKGGGILGRTTMKDQRVIDARQRAKKTDKPNRWLTGNDEDQFVETIYVYCLLLDSPDAERASGWAIFPLTSTKIAPWRNILTRMYQRRIGEGMQPPIFTNRVTATSQFRSGTYDFYTVQFRPAINNDEEASAIPVRRDNPIVADALAFLDSINKGNVEFDEESLVDNDSTTSEDEIDTDNF